MHQRDPRPAYSYDDQSTAYPPGHVPHHSGEYVATGYQQYDGSTHYYAAPTHTVGNVNEYTNHSNTYVRSMTPSLVPTHRYPNSPRDSRYLNSHGVVASSSSLSISQPTYAPQNQYYDAPYIPPEYRTHHPHPRIPTPSEIANSYSNYPHHLTTPQSPTIPEDPYASPSLDYPAPLHLVPSSHAQGVHGHHRPRIVTGRPRTASAAASTSPTSASSPSGERFPCDKCGKTFSRSHDRKRHHETQHLVSPVIHSCKYCGKEFSRADSLKRHLDNGCDEMPTLPS
ncbi:hypothetical protein BYT27DRAFT_6362667 [Phlegmacium glaucopus]|nr:hypothetical protein BYT27DRAFT_6362667 [Phlegmacium glaucopus]